MFNVGPSGLIDSQEDHTRNLALCELALARS